LSSFSDAFNDVSTREESTRFTGEAMLVVATAGFTARVNGGADADMDGNPDGNACEPNEKVSSSSKSSML
jgi:hypothetical protein